MGQMPLSHSYTHNMFIISFLTISSASLEYYLRYSSPVYISYLSICLLIPVFLQLFLLQYALLLPLYGCNKKRVEIIPNCFLPYNTTTCPFAAVFYGILFSVLFPEISFYIFYGHHSLYPFAVLFSLYTYLCLFCKILALCHKFLLLIFRQELEHILIIQFSYRRVFGNPKQLSLKPFVP